MAANYDLLVWEYCKENKLLTTAIPKSLCVSLRVLNMGPMSKYSSLMLFLMQTRYVQINFPSSSFKRELYLKENVCIIAIIEMLINCVEMLLTEQWNTVFL